MSLPAVIALVAIGATAWFLFALHLGMGLGSWLHDEEDDR